MNNFYSCIDTDSGIGSILSNFETAWVMHTVEDSLNLKFRPFDSPLPNFVDILNRQFDMLVVAGEDYKEKVETVRIETYKEIIDAICSYYGLVLTAPIDNMNIAEVYGITRTIYDVFISRFTEYIIDFYITYIIQNSDAIYNYLINDPDVKKLKEKEVVNNNIYLDSKFMLIHANLNKVILNMTTYDIPLNTLLKFFLDTPIYNTISEYLQDTGDIYRNHYASYLTDNRYMAELLTAIKLKLQSQTITNQNFINKGEM